MQGEIVDLGETGRPEALLSLGQQQRGRRLTVRKLLGDFGHHAMEQRGDLPLRGREVDVARRQGETVGLSHGGHRHDVDGNIQIAHHLLHDRQLLIVLLAKVGAVRQGLEQQLAHHGRDAVEMPRAVKALEHVAHAGDADGRGEALRIHLIDPWREEKIATVLGQQPSIPGLVARVSTQVFLAVELLGIDEDRRHRPVALGGRARHQGHVTGVQSPHRRDQSDRLSSTAPRLGRLAELVDAAQDRQQTIVTRHPLRFR